MKWGRWEARLQAGWLFFGTFLSGTGFVQGFCHPAEITREKQLVFCLAFLGRISEST